MNYLELVLNQNGKNSTDNMQIFLSGYINKYKYMSLDYLVFRSYFNSFVDSQFSAEDAQTYKGMVDWDAWVIQGGNNPYQLDFSTPDATVYQMLAQEYIDLDGTDQSPKNITLY